jgi:hypothetical protein
MIIIDDRAGSDRLMLYPALSGVAELSRLEFGDAAFAGNGPDGPILVGVEVKSIFDLISSMNTGRLQGTQIPGLLANYDESWLLYYGAYRPGTDGHLEVRRRGQWRRHRLGTRDVPYGYVEAFLLDLVAVGVHVKRVYDEGEAVAWLMCAYRWWSKPWEKHHGLRAFDKSKSGPSLLPDIDDDVRFRAMVAKELPGLGFERAVAAARHFPSVSAMVNASVEDWSHVKGVGKVIAKAVHSAVR